MNRTKDETQKKQNCKNETFPAKLESAFVLNRLIWDSFGDVLLMGNFSKDNFYKNECSSTKSISLRSTNFEYKIANAFKLFN